MFLTFSTIGRYAPAGWLATAGTAVTRSAASGHSPTAGVAGGTLRAGVGDAGSELPVTIGTCTELLGSADAVGVGVAVLPVRTFLPSDFALEQDDHSMRTATNRTPRTTARL